MRTDPDMESNRTARAALAGVGIAVIIAAAGCGGSAGSHHATTDGTAAATAASAGTGEAPATRPKPTGPAPSPHRSVQSSDPVSQGAKVQRARTTGADDDENQATGAKPVNPCALVTRAEAGVIIGRAIARMTSAPQGPTCIYQARGAKRPVTLAIQATSLATLRRQSKELGRVSVKGRRAYCIKLGSVRTLVPLSGGRVLTVDAPCPMAASFAAKALARVH
jgi:hypothetical protein